MNTSNRKSTVRLDKHLTIQLQADKEQLEKVILGHEQTIIAQAERIVQLETALSTEPIPEDKAEILERITEAQDTLVRLFPPEEYGESHECQLIWETLEELKPKS